MTPITASFITDFWNDQLVANQLQGLFLVLAGFLGSFGFIRMSTRIMRSPRISWWPGSVVSDGGVHVHHLVFGIVAMMAAGTLGFTLTTSPWYEIAAALFGIGIGLTIDEFALWVHLDDVYWSREGRTSVDATVLAAAIDGADPARVPPVRRPDRHGRRRGRDHRPHAGRPDGRLHMLCEVAA